MYYGHSTCTCCSPSACSCYDQRTRMYHALSTCMYYGHRTCTCYVRGTCIYYDHRTCMSYGHSTCTMSIVHVCTVRVPVPRSRCIGAWAPRCFLGSELSRLGASVFSRLGASAPRRLGAAVPRCLHVSSVLDHLISCIYARLHSTFNLQCEVSRLPPSSTSQMTRCGTSPRYEFRLRLFNYRPPSPAHSLDFNVQARWRGGAYLKRVP